MYVLLYSLISINISYYGSFRNNKFVIKNELEKYFYGTESCINGLDINNIIRPFK